MTLSVLLVDHTVNIRSKSELDEALALLRKGRYVRYAPRYAFSNRSEDILKIFQAACELAGIRYTRASRKQIAVYNKAAVARLDTFVGTKR